MREFEQWDGFTGRLWKEGIDVRDFIQNNYTPYPERRLLHALLSGVPVICPTDGL